MEYKQVPAKETKISNIKDFPNSKVRLTGTVISTQEDSFMLDDTTGAIRVVAEKSAISTLCENTIVQVLGWAIINPQADEIRAEIITPLNGINLKLYRRANEAVGKEDF